MTTNNRAAAAVSIILATGLCIGYAGFHAMRKAEASRIAVAKKLTALNVKISEMEATVAANKQEPKEIEASRRKSPWRTTAGERSSASGPERKIAPTIGLKVTAFQLAAYRERLGLRYGPLYQTLGLSQAQIAEFENLLTAQKKELLDLKIVALADGQDASAPEIAALRQEEDDKLRVAQIALLGEAGYRQLQQFNRILPVQDFVLFRLELSAGFPPEPLTDLQVQQLTSVLANGNSSYRDGGPVSNDPADSDWDAILGQARGILSAPQFDGFKTSIYKIKLDQLGRQFSQQEQELK